MFRIECLVVVLQDSILDPSKKVGTFDDQLTEKQESMCHSIRQGSGNRVKELKQISQKEAYLVTKASILKSIFTQL